MARYTTEAEVRTLQKYASLSNIGIVEIGVLDGETTREISKVTNLPIYGIDPIIPDSMDQNLIGSKEQILNNMSGYESFTFYSDYSFNVVKNFQNKFDFIFIDGDHKYEAVKRDFLDWFELLEVGGYILFHDSGPVTSIRAEFKGWEGCIKIVNEIKEDSLYLKCLEWIENVDTINVFRKINNL